MFTGIRENVTPTASNMNMLTYSDDMEKVAADWVSKCLFWYPNFNGTNMILQETGQSENHFKTAGFYASQARNYNYTDNTCKGNCRYYKLVRSFVCTRIYFKLEMTDWVSKYLKKNSCD
uniref:SCP domain-containing protein n=1 Tax=Mesocestoides corti TaxID=53468 RepID=A0A5K3FYV5_MESCO